MWPPTRAFVQLRRPKGERLRAPPLFRPLLALRGYVELSQKRDSFSRWELLLPGVFVLDEFTATQAFCLALPFKGEIECPKRM